MASERPTRATVYKYLLLQLPSLALLTVVLLILDHWLGLTALVFWSILAAWVSKDLLLFPLLWRAYQSSPHPADPIIGSCGITRELLEPCGYVEIRGTLWHAELVPSLTSLAADCAVEVVAINGITLTVRPHQYSGQEPQPLTTGSRQQHL